MDNCSFHYGQVSTKSSVSLCTCELLHFVFLKRRPTWISRGDHGRALARQRRRVEGVYSPGTDAFSLKTASYFLIPLPRFLPSSLEIWVLDSLQHHISSICLPQRKTFRRLFPHSMNDSCAKILNISLLNEGPNDLNPWSDVKEMHCFRGVYLPLMVWPENTTGFISTHNTLLFLKS